MWPILVVSAVFVVVFLCVWGALHELAWELEWLSNWRGTLAPLRISASVVLVPGLIVASVMFGMEGSRRYEQRLEREQAEYLKSIEAAQEEEERALKSRVAIALNKDHAKCLEAATALGIDVEMQGWRGSRGLPLFSCRTPIADCVLDGNSTRDCEVHFGDFPLEDYIFRGATSGDSSQPQAGSYGERDDDWDSLDEGYTSYDGDSYDPDEFVPYDNGREIVECPGDVWGDEPCG